MRIRCLTVALLLVAPFLVAGCGDVPTSPTQVFASCNGNPPGQQPSGNPAHAPGNSSSLDKDCKNAQ